MQMCPECENIFDESEGSCPYCEEEKGDYEYSIVYDRNAGEAIVVPKEDAWQYE